MTKFKEKGSTLLPAYYGAIDKHFDKVKPILIEAGVKFRKAKSDPFLEIRVSWKTVDGARAVSKVVDILLRHTFAGGWPRELRKDWYKYLHC